MPKILVTGGAGQFARAVAQVWHGADLIIPDESILDLRQQRMVQQLILGVKPDVVINAGALTAVDRCEAEPQLAAEINATAVSWLADSCCEVGALLVQISTDYVFDGTGKRPYREDDLANPQSVYGRTKLQGEVEARRAPEHLIVRTSWLYDAWGKNFYRTMLHAAAQGRALRVVSDQTGTPTTCRALARQVQVAVGEGWRGVVHGTCSGEATWHEFAKEIFARSGISADLSPCSTVDYPLPAPRPAYSVLDGSHRSVLGTDVMPHWREALADVIQNPEIK